MFIWPKTFFLLTWAFSLFTVLLWFLLQRYDRLQAVRISPWLFFSSVKNHFCIWLDTNKQKMKHTLRATWEGWITLQESIKNAMVFRHTLLSELLQLSVLVEKRSFSSQDVVTGRRLQCLSIHVRNGCKSSEYCCCEILIDRRLHIPICSGLNAVPHPHKEYAHVLTPRARSSLEKMPSWV